jgi:hypothetical protein
MRDASPGAAGAFGGARDPLIRVLCACEDAGGARALAPVLRQLLERGDPIDFWLGRVAAEILQADLPAAGAAPIAEASELERRLAVWGDWQVLLSASTSWGLRIEGRAVQAARAQGCPSLTLIDFPSQYAERLSLDGPWSALGDRAALVDVPMRDDLLALGVPAERLEVTGSPAFDALLQAPPPASPPASDHVLFLSQPIAALFGDGPSRESFLGYTELTVLRALAPLVAQEGVRLVIRPHPREDAGQLEQLAATLPGEIAIDPSGTLGEAVDRARLVVGMMTMGLVEAALRGASVVSAQLHRRGPDPLPSNRVGLTFPALSEAELAGAVHRLLASPRERGETLARVAALGWRPGAAGRVVAALDRLAAR